MYFSTYVNKSVHIDIHVSQFTFFKFRAVRKMKLCHISDIYLAELRWI